MPASAIRTVRFHAPLRGVSVQAMANGRVDPPAVPSDTEAEDRKTKPVDPPDELATTNTLLQQINEQLAEMDHARQDQLVELQRAAVELSVAVAAHVLKKSVDANEFQLEELVHSAVEQLRPHKVTTIHVNPKDKAYFDSLPKERMRDLSERADIVEDPKLPRGSCRVFAGDHGLVSRLDTRLGDLRRSLLEGIEYARAER